MASVLTAFEKLLGHSLFSAQTAGLSSVVQLTNTPFLVLTVTAGMGSAGSLGMFISPTQL